MSVKASLSLGISVLVVSTKPGNAPRQAILKKKDFFLVMVGRHPEFLSRSGLKQVLLPFVCPLRDGLSW